MRALNVEVTLWTELWCIKDAFGGNGEALKVFLAGIVVKSSGAKMLHDLGAAFESQPLVSGPVHSFVIFCLHYQTAALVLIFFSPLFMVVPSPLN